MASRKISAYQTQASFTGVIITDATKYKTGFAQTQIVLRAGYEYVGFNIHKLGSRPPKLRILNIFTPLLPNGSPNATADTYVAYQIYDYSLSIFRGPRCGGTTLSAASTGTPLDFYVSTIDKFGKNYGNLYFGNNTGYSSVMTPPQVIYKSSGNLNLANTSGSILINSGHMNGILRLGAQGATINVHGFLNLSGYAGTWLLYSIVDLNTNITKSFENTLNRTEFRTNIYPYIVPNKITNEWRYMPLCDINTTAMSYFPLNNTGGIKFMGPTPPSNPRDVIATPDTGVYTVDIYKTETSLFSAITTPSETSSVFTDEQGTVELNSGYYSSENYYAYYNQATKTFDGYQRVPGSVTYVGINLFDRVDTQNHPIMDPMSSCAIGSSRSSVMLYYDSIYPTVDIGTIMYTDQLGTATAPSGWYYYWERISYFIDETGTVQQVVPC